MTDAGKETPMPCPHCGHELLPGDGFCGGCGRPAERPDDPHEGPPEEPSSVEPEPAPEPQPTAIAGDAPTPAAGASGPAAGIRPGSRSWLPTLPATLRTGVVIRGLPLELWLVIALVGISGILALAAAGIGIDQVAELEFLDGTLLAVVVLLYLIVASAGLALLAIAHQLGRGSRVARGVTYVLTGSLVTDVLFSDYSPRTQTIALVVSLAACAVLALAPAVREVFERPDTEESAAPSAIVSARACLAASTYLATVLAIVYFILGSIEGRFVVYGLIALAAAGALLLGFQRLRLPDPGARLLATGASVVGFVAAMLGPGRGGVGVVIALLVAIPAFLWLAPGARARFGDRPLQLTTAPGATSAMPPLPAITAPTTTHPSMEPAPSLPAVVEPQPAPFCADCGAAFLAPSAGFCSACGAAREAR